MEAKIKVTLSSMLSASKNKRKKEKITQLVWVTSHFITKWEPSKTHGNWSNYDNENPCKEMRNTIKDRQAKRENNWRDQNEINTTNNIPKQ